MTSLRKLNPGYLALILAVIIWGSTFIVAKLVMRSVGPFAMAVTRMSIGLLVMLPFAIRRGLRPAMLLERRFIFFGLTGVTLFFGLENPGLLLTSASNGALIQAAVPAVTVLLSIWMLNEGVSLPRLAGVALSIIGVLLITGSGGGDNSVLGNLLVIGSVISWGFYTIQGRRLAGVPPLVSTTAGFITGTLMLLPFAAWELARGQAGSLTLPALAGIAYLGIGASALAYTLWNYALKRVEASAASTFVNLIPVVGLVGALIGGEQVQALQLAGGAIAVLGVWLCSRPQRQPAREA